MGLGHGWCLHCWGPDPNPAPKDFEEKNNSERKGSLLSHSEIHTPADYWMTPETETMGFH